MSGADGFVTYNTNSLAEVKRFDWVGGGLNPPVIGPKGHVYAIASNILFVFPPPKLVNSTIKQPQSGMTIATNPDAGTTPQEKLYDPPLTAAATACSRARNWTRTTAARATTRTSPSPGAKSRATRRSRTTTSTAKR